MRRLIALVCLAVTVAGCKGFPDLDTAVGTEIHRAPYPALMPLGALLAGSADGTTTAEDGSALAARAAALRARAARQQGPVVDAATKARLAAAVARHEG